MDIFSILIQLNNNNNSQCTPLNSNKITRLTQVHQPIQITKDIIP